MTNKRMEYSIEKNVTERVWRLVEAQIAGGSQESIASLFGQTVLAVARLRADLRLGGTCFMDSRGRTWRVLREGDAGGLLLRAEPGE